MTRIAILGSTGSIGRQALEVLEGDAAREAGLVAHSLVCAGNTPLLREQIDRFEPSVAGVVSMEAPRLDAPSSWRGSLIRGGDALRAACEEADLVLNAIVGFAGLEASLICEELGKPLALANKESLVIGGALLGGLLGEGLVVPVDSEHSTIYRCLLGETCPPLGLYLTASGGSVRDMPPERIEQATPEEVLRHPNWRMGPRITVDSSTMVNKAFEVMEAGWLFDMPFERIGVLVHPQSLIHSLVRLGDGSLKALLGRPDMRVPIAWALGWRDSSTGDRALYHADDDPLRWGSMELLPLDHDRYPAFDVVLSAGRAGGTAPAAANAADEVAVAAFLEGRIPFGAVASLIESVMERHEKLPASLESIRAADARSRGIASELLEGYR